jgi:hypothetical protein
MGKISVVFGAKKLAYWYASSDKPVLLPSSMYPMRLLVVVALGLEGQSLFNPSDRGQTVHSLGTSIRTTDHLPESAFSY